ncbi:hypothetical protein GGI11_002555 [Coemansia sp. RSA 2049]|nr:hypothetical protein GGI11_002555 [Coemansia sp. RSA 2049]KAJ2603518.1 hypothetical protein EV177_006679 [Coemansia sp. RSA 1804]KAJ2683315.1 hypothetical protein GGH99_004406 [Coemansia sp. RSA 1285]
MTNTTSFTLRYFPVAARAETCKALLFFIGAEWVLEAPEWPREKGAQRVGKLPVLIEHSASDTKESFVLGDSRAIEEYLATKYSLYYQPDDAQLMARQRELRAHMHDIYELSAMIIHAPELARPFFISKYLALARCVVDTHERVLKENGSNGHYFGNSTTYLDIAALAGLLTFRKTFIHLVPELLVPLDKTNAPEINNAVEILSKDPAFASYISALETCNNAE